MVHRRAAESADLPFLKCISFFRAARLHRAGSPPSRFPRPEHRWEPANQNSEFERPCLPVRRRRLHQGTVLEVSDEVRECSYPWDGDWPTELQECRHPMCQLGPSYYKTD